MMGTLSKSVILCAVVALGACTNPNSLGQGGGAGAGSGVSAIEPGSASDPTSPAYFQPTIGDRVLVGMGAIVMDGAVVEDDVVIAAGAVVPPGKTLESGFLYVGSPCRQARPLKEGEFKFFTYGANNYVKLKDQYIEEGF